MAVRRGPAAACNRYAWVLATMPLWLLAMFWLLIHFTTDETVLWSLGFALGFCCTLLLMLIDAGRLARDGDHDVPSWWSMTIGGVICLPLTIGFYLYDRGKRHLPRRQGLFWVWNLGCAAWLAIAVLA